MTATFRALALWVGLCSWACASPIDPQVEPVEDEAEPVAIVDGGSLSLFEGLQGGYHFWLGVRAAGVDPRAPSVTITIAPVSTGRPLQSLRLSRDLSAQLDGSYAHRGIARRDLAARVFRRAADRAPR